jgi:hypothetical protein
MTGKNVWQKGEIITSTVRFAPGDSFAHFTPSSSLSERTLFAQIFPTGGLIEAQK